MFIVRKSCPKIMVEGKLQNDEFKCQNQIKSIHSTMVSILHIDKKHIIIEDSDYDVNMNHDEAITELCWVFGGLTRLRNGKIVKRPKITNAQQKLIDNGFDK